MRRLSMIVAVALLGGCSGGVSQESYDQVTVGMSQPKVEEILGSGEEQTSGGHGISAGGVLSGNKQPTNEKTFLWKEGGLMIIVIFKDGAVVSKSKQGF
jgi:hypothetical protein